MRYWTLRRWLPRFGLGYVLAGLLAAAAPGFEVFPFFCWFLFPIVPGAEPRFELVVHAHGGETLSPPQDIQQLDLLEDPMAMDLWLLTQRLGRAAQADDINEIERTRTLIEANFVCAPSRYTVDEVRFDPLERYATGKVRARTVVAHFQSATGCGRSPWAR